MSNNSLPSWPNADAVYGRAYRVLERMAQAGHATKAVVSRGRVLHPGSVSQDMRDLIDALNKGDEERIKGLLLNLRGRGFAPE